MNPYFPFQKPEEPEFQPLYLEIEIPLEKEEKEEEIEYKTIIIELF